MSTTCPGCGASMAPDAKFCAQCGERAPTIAAADPVRAALDRGMGAQYEVVRLLGRGGMGAVYLGRDRTLDRAVAIKVLPPEYATDPESRERFRREARTAASLTHPNIVPLHAFGEVEGMPYIVMGYVRGESLATRLRREGKIPPDEARRILGQLADALDYAHRRGVVHRDIKPDNVLVDDESGRPMLTDFGVAKVSAAGTTLTGTGVVVGTPHYMSPEQASGERTLDGRSDLYSLGVMGYAMLAGRLPFEGESFREVLVRHVTEEPVRLRSLEPGAPDDLARAITRCLAKEPAARWPDGASLKRAIQQEEDDEELQSADWIQGSLDGVVPMALPLALGTTFFWWASYLFPGIRSKDGPWWGPAALMTGLVVLAPIGLAIVARVRGTPWSEIVRLALRQPRWWPFWYPKRWRREGDVWERLPVFVRRMRTLNAAGLALYLLAVPAFGLWIKDFLAAPGAEPWWLKALTWGAFGLGMLGLGGPRFALQRWARMHGLDPRKFDSIALAPTGRRDLWRKPRYAALLSPPEAAASTSSAREPQGPHDFVHAIGEAVKQLSGAVREAGAQALDAARQLVTELAHLDQELTAIVRDAESADATDIERRLLALGTESSADGEARREMRRLLQSQLALARGLRSQTETVRAQRERLVDLLKALWLAVAALRAQTRLDALDQPEITGRVRQILEEIKGWRQGMETARLLTRGDRESSRPASV